MHIRTKLDIDKLKITKKPYICAECYASGLMRIVQRSCNSFLLR